MSERIHRISEYGMVIGFLLLTACVLGVSIWRPKEGKSFFENRSLASVSESGDFTELEQALCDNAAFRTTLSMKKAWCDIHLFHRPVVNEIVVTDDSVLLPYKPYEPVNLPSIRWHSDQIGQQLAALNEQVKSWGGTFLYTAVPCKYAYDADLYPSYLYAKEDYNQEANAAFFAALDRYGVPYLDIGEVWTKGEGQPRYLSSVDHHYTWEGCYTLYRAIMERLISDGGKPLAVLSEDDLSVETAPNPYLGSYARKLCRQWTLDEPFRYGVVKENIPFTRYNYGNTTPAKSSLFSFPELWWEDMTFTAYLGGDLSEMLIETNRPELPSILIFGDSFTNGVETLAYASFDEMRSLDLRYYKGSLMEYLDAHHPDYVVCIRDYEQLLNRSGNGRIADS